MRSGRISVAAAVAALGLVLAGCSGSSDDDDGGGSRTPDSGAQDQTTNGELPSDGPPAHSTEDVGRP